MTAALQVTLDVQVDELKKWDKPCYEFMQLLSLLPAFNYMSDLKSYWKQIHPEQKLNPIIESLLHKGLIKAGEEEHVALKIGDEIRIQMATSVRNYLTLTLKARYGNKEINLMLATNYRDKMKAFYFTYKNGCFSARDDDLF